jgi:hypothetical protein
VIALATGICSCYCWKLLIAKIFAFWGSILQKARIGLRESGQYSRMKHGGLKGVSC